MRLQKVPHNVVVVAGVQRDIVAPRLRHRAYHVDRLVAVERRDLDRHHTDQWPSNPPTIRRSTARTFTSKRCAFKRSSPMLSSLPVYSAISSRPDSATARTTSIVL